LKHVLILLSSYNKDYTASSDLSLFYDRSIGSIDSIGFNNINN